MSEFFINWKWTSVKSTVAPQRETVESFVYFRVITAPFQQVLNVTASNYPKMEDIHHSQSVDSLSLVGFCNVNFKWKQYPEHRDGLKFMVGSSLNLVINSFGWGRKSRSLTRRFLSADNVFKATRVSDVFFLAVSGNGRSSIDARIARANCARPPFRLAERTECFFLSIYPTLYSSL